VSDLIIHPSSVNLCSFLLGLGLAHGMGNTLVGHTLFAMINGQSVNLRQCWIHVRITVHYCRDATNVFFSPQANLSAWCAAIVACGGLGRSTSTAEAS